MCNRSSVDLTDTLPFALHLFTIRALGVIVYIMLTGVHPFDVNGRASDAEIERDIRDARKPLPLGPGNPYTRHLSPSALDLIGRLMERDPRRRLSAFEMLHHPWVTGEKASTDVMAGSDKRLNKFRRFKVRRRACVGMKENIRCVSFEVLPYGCPSTFPLRWPLVLSVLL